MIVKTVSILISVFILGNSLCIYCNTVADGELDGEDVEERQPKDELNIPNEEVFIETSSGKTVEEKPPESNVQTIYANNSISNSSSVNNSTSYVSCILNKFDSTGVVEIVNASKLASILLSEPNVTNRQVPGSCIAALFYSPSCPFSCMAAPHFNALPRFFPDVKMVAIDVVKHRNYNTQFGIVGTPTILLFHGGRPAAKYNETSEYSLEVFANFITRHTGIQPEGKLVVTSADFGGPVTSVLVKETDYYLILSWMAIAARILYSLYYSTWGRSFVDATLNAWREAEAQHHHAD